MCCAIKDDVSAKCIVLVHHRRVQESAKTASLDTLSIITNNNKYNQTANACTLLLPSHDEYSPSSCVSYSAGILLLYYYYCG